MLFAWFEIHSALNRYRWPSSKDIGLEGQRIGEQLGKVELARIRFPRGSAPSSFFQNTEGKRFTTFDDRFDSILCHVFNDFLPALPVADGVELVLTSECMTASFGSKQPLPESIR